MTRPICIPGHMIIFPEMGSVIKYTKYHDNTSAVVSVAIVYLSAIPSGRDFLLFKGESEQAILIFHFLAEQLNAIIIHRSDE